MTPEQIAALTPAALRLEIARRLGWKDVSPMYESCLWLGQPPDGWMMGTGVPDWPTDIGAAWELFNGMTGRPFIYKMMSGQWHIGTVFDFPQAISVIVEIESEIPMAICRAWLECEEWTAAQP